MKIRAYAAFLGFVSVLMGALGDHALTLDENMMESFETALRYNMVYAVLILCLSFWVEQFKLSITVLLFCLGITFFSFSIYASLLFQMPQLTYLTPVGGFILMAGWGLLFCSSCWEVLKAKKG